MPDVYVIYDLWMQNLDGSVTRPHANGNINRLLEDYAAQASAVGQPWWITKRLTSEEPNPHSRMIRRRVGQMGPHLIP